MWQENLNPESQELEDDETWPGPLGGHGAKLTEKHVKWMANPKLYRRLHTRWTVPKAKLLFDDHSVICYDWTKIQVKETLAFRTTSASEQIAPRVFSSDRDGAYHPLAVHLRTMVNGFGLADRNRQRNQIQLWINDPLATMVNEQADCDILLQYCSLEAQAFTYVTELIEVYDRARCYWVHLIVSDDINKLVVSRKLKAKNENVKFGWKEVEACIFKQLTDVASSIKIIKSLLRLRRKKTKATLWVAEKVADRAWMERPPQAGEPAPCIMSEYDWLTSVIGWMSEAEIRDFKIPALSRIHELDPADNPPWTLAKVQALVEASMSPPAFHGADSAYSRAVIQSITDSHQDLKNSGYMKKEVHVKTMDDDKAAKSSKEAALQHRSNEGNDNSKSRYPKTKRDYEKLDKLPFKTTPTDPKHRQQAKVHDAMKKGLCLNCFEPGHVSRNCPKEMTPATKHFHKMKMKFWNCCAESSSEPLENRMTLAVTTAMESFGNSTFTGGTTMQAVANLYIPTHGYELPNADGTFSSQVSPNLVPTTIGIDTHGDATIVLREHAFRIRPVEETMNTGGGESLYEEEGLVIVEGEPGVFTTIPALIANTPDQLPYGCDLLIGNGEIREMKVSLDYHRDAPRGSTLQADLSSRFQPPRSSGSPPDPALQCNMGEKDCRKWLDKNGDKPPDVSSMSIDDIHYFPDLPPEAAARYKAASIKFRTRFEGQKGSVPPLANHPPVKLKFKEGWPPQVSGTRRYAPAQSELLFRWGKAQLASGGWAPSNAPKDVDVAK